MEPQAKLPGVSLWHAPERFAALGEICEAAVHQLTLDGAALTIVSTDATRVFVHATDALSFELDELQFSLAEGPCIDAVFSRDRVLADTINNDESLARWPAFARDASTLDVGAEFAFPMTVHDRAFAVLQTYRLESGPLDDAATQVVADILDYYHEPVLTELNSYLAEMTTDSPPMQRRSVVRQATGMVAAQLEFSGQDALTYLRFAAYADNVPVTELARNVVDGTRRFERDDDDK